MDLLHEIEDLLRSGYNISFGREINQFSINVSKLTNKNKFLEEYVFLPFDHLTEEKIVKYIKLQRDKIDKESNK